METGIGALIIALIIGPSANAALLVVGLVGTAFQQRGDRRWAFIVGTPIFAALFDWIATCSLPFFDH